MYHELSHDILDLKDLEAIDENKGKLMYPELSSYENKNMDEFIESSHALFEEHSKKYYSQWNVNKAMMNYTWYTM